MGKQKDYWYVLVLTEEGPVFVTDVDNATKVAKWNKHEPPCKLTEYWAKDLAVGLRCNLFLAYAVCNGVEITHQPYHYDSGAFEWKEKRGD